MRALELLHGRKVILSDTVGFIADLPTQLIAAFRATLEEVLSADLIVHVRDIAHLDTEAQRNDVIEVLAELGVEESNRTTEMIEAWNKSDLLNDDGAIEKQNIADRSTNIVLMSAVTGQGTNDLLALIEEKLAQKDHILKLAIPHECGADIAWAYENGEVLERNDNSETMMSELTVRFAYAKFDLAKNKFAENLEQ